MMLTRCNETKQRVLTFKNVKANFIEKQGMGIPNYLT